MRWLVLLVLAGCEMPDLTPRGCEHLIGVAHEPIAGPYTLEVSLDGEHTAYSQRCPRLDGLFTCDGHIVMITGLDAWALYQSINGGPWVRVELQERRPLAPDPAICSYRVGQAR